MNKTQIVPWPTIPFETRIINLFWSWVEKTDGCWIWTGFRDHNNRGSFVPGSQRQGVPKWQTHRFAWFITFGVIPIGLSVLHKCDNPPCCRPDHLFIGTQKDNMQDALKKGRTLRGDNCPWAKLTAEQVILMRRRYRSEYISYTDLAKDFGIHPTTVGEIMRRKKWAHV
jgi:hypothetical protein